MPTVLLPAASAESYLKIPSIIAAAATTRSEAIHPGWGFLAENPAFAQACAENDLVFVGPSAETMTRMGDKAVAKQEMDAAGVPLVPGTLTATTLDEARAAADDAGYPVLLKAVAGGGGKGMRLVRDPDELEGAFQTAGSEAQASFGEPALYVEKAIVPARHVEIQVLADGQGGVLTLGERECSIQRRHQKLIEESPSPALDDDTRAAMEDAAERAARAVDYRNAGTFEFILGTGGSFYFIELNARLQVEHPVSELVTGIDLVREQLRVAARLSPRPAAPSAAGMRSRSGSTPRTRPATFSPSPDESSASVHRWGPECASTRTSRMGPSCHRTMTRSSPRSSSGTRTGRRRSTARFARSPSSRSWGCRRLPQPHATSSAPRSSRADATRPASWRRPAGACRR